MWQQFLSSQRIGAKYGTPGSSESGGRSRSEFHKDYDRIIFSSAFRRLSDKTQVVPFPQSDYTRQRLTHSLEVSCVGRSLATNVYEMVREDVCEIVSQGDFEAIVAAACLAHDIGNPPFGHFGEKAIQDWASALPEQIQNKLTNAELQDLRLFEGNAQSFRVLTRLQMSNRSGGMRLTAATLGALIKYPRFSDGTSTVYKKHGCFQHDASLFHEVFDVAGRTITDRDQYARHPLALLSEAADDICYAIIDLEDGCRAGLIPIAEALELFENIRPSSTGSTSMPDSDRLSMGRAVVINELVNQCADVFESDLDCILDGTFEGSLIDATAKPTAYKATKKLAFSKVFRSERVLELEAAGYRAIQGLLSTLMTAAFAEECSGIDGHVRDLTGLDTCGKNSAYEKLLACTDIVSAMTDRRCMQLYRTLNGIDALPA